MIKKKKLKSYIKSSDSSHPSNKITKVKLSRIVRSEYTSKINTINEIVNRISNIITHTYSFLKLFCINYYSHHHNLPEINKTFILMIMKTVSDSSSGK